MPLPQLNYRSKSLRIKNEILDGIRNAVKVEEQEPEQEDGFIEGDMDQIKGDNAVNDSDFIDFKLLNLQKQATTDRDSELKKRMSLVSEMEGEGDDRSIMITRHISAFEDKTKLPGMTKESSINTQSPHKGKKDNFMSSTSIMQLKNDMTTPCNQNDISDIDFFNQDNRNSGTSKFFGYK